jgi:hypothetical protein
MIRLLTMLLVLAAPPDVAAVEPLGRLFLTPERRDVLERQRRTGKLEHAPADGEGISLDGAVTRSGGKTTVWINGRPQHDEALVAGVASRQPHRATLRGSDGTLLQLRVGEAVREGSRTQADLVAPGAIRVGAPQSVGD